MIQNGYTKLRAEESPTPSSWQQFIRRHRRHLLAILVITCLCVALVTCLSDRCNWFHSSTGCTLTYNQNHDTSLPKTCSPPTKGETTKRLPNGLIIGVRKGGTGAVSFYLRFHPWVHIVASELNFFDSNYDKGYDWYRQQFPQVFPGNIVMEKTSNYFHNKNTIKRIYDMDKNIKLILVVRDPIHRTVSDFVQRKLTAIGINDSEVNVNDHLLDDFGEVRTNIRILKPSVYYRYMKKWLEVFPLSQIHVVDGDNLIRNPYEEVFKLENFLGLPHCLTKEKFFYNRSKGFYCFITPNREKCLPKSKGRQHPTLTQEVKQKLKDYFRPYNEMFFDLIKQTFNWNS